MHMYNSDFISVQSKIDLSGFQGDPFIWYTNASHATPECSAQTILIKKLFHTSSLLSRLIIPHRPHMSPHAAIGSAAPGASSFSLGRSDCPLVSPALSYTRPTLLSIPLPRPPLLPLSSISYTQNIVCLPDQKSP